VVKKTFLIKTKRLINVHSVIRTYSKCNFKRF